MLAAEPTAGEPENPSSFAANTGGVVSRSARHSAIFNSLFDYLPDALIDMIHVYSQDLCAFAVGGRIGPQFSSQVAYIPIDFSQSLPCSSSASSTPLVPSPSLVPALSLSDGATLSSSDSVWRVLPPLHLDRVSCTAVCYGNRVYALGGRTSEGISSSCEVFDFRHPLRGWEFIADMNLARMSAASTIYEEVKGVGGGKIILAGGLSHRGPEQSCEIYDIDAGKWLVHLIPVTLSTQVDQLQVDHITGNLIAIGRSIEDGEMSVETFPLQRLQQNSRRLTRSSRMRAFSNTPPLTGEFGELQWTFVDRNSIQLYEMTPKNIHQCLRVYRVSVPMSIDDDGVEIESAADKESTVLESKEENIQEKPKKKKAVRMAEILVEWHDEKFCLRSSTRGHTIAQDYESQDYIQMSITGESATVLPVQPIQSPSTLESKSNSSTSSSAAAAVAASSSPPLKPTAPPSRACVYVRDSLAAAFTTVWSLPSLPNGRLFCGTALGAVDIWE